MNSTSTHDSSHYETSDSLPDDYPIRLTVQLALNGLEDLGQQNVVVKTQQRPHTAPNIIIRGDDLDEEYYSCDSDTCDCDTDDIRRGPSKATDRHMSILKLLREVVNLIDDDIGIKDEAVRIVNTCPIPKVASTIKPCTPVDSDNYIMPYSLDMPQGIGPAASYTNNSDCACTIMNPQNAAFPNFYNESVPNVSKISYKCPPQRPISRSNNYDTTAVCICPQQTGDCPVHGPPTNTSKSDGDSCTCSIKNLKNYTESLDGDEDFEDFNYSEDISPSMECLCLMEQYECPIHKVKLKLVKEDPSGVCLCKSNKTENEYRKQPPVWGTKDSLREPYDPVMNSRDNGMFVLPEGECDKYPPVWGDKAPPEQLYDPCKNMQEYEMYKLPDELVKTHPPVWGSKRAHLDDDNFPDTSCCTQAECFEEEGSMDTQQNTSEFPDLSYEPEQDIIHEEQYTVGFTSEIVESTEIGDGLYGISLEEICEIECEEFGEEYGVFKTMKRRVRNLSDSEKAKEAQKSCNCCHCKATRGGGKCDCTTVATMQGSQLPVDDQMKFFIDSLILDLESMQYARRKYQAQSDICLKKPESCVRDSFPVTITDVTDLGINSLFIKWKIHNRCGVAGYEVYVDGYLTNRYYSGQHEAAVVIDVDITKPHKIALVAQASKADDSIATICAELKRTTDCKSLPWKTGTNKPKPSASPQLCDLWIPSIYMYDPADCEKSPTLMKSIR